MARRSNTVQSYIEPQRAASQSETVPDDDQQFDDELLDVAESPADRIAAMLRGMGGDDARAKLSVHRVKENGKTVYCAQYTPAEFEEGGLDMIRRSWGGGVYRIMVYGPLPDSNGWGIRARTVVEMEEPRHAPEPRAVAPAVDPSLIALLEKIDQRLGAVEAAPRIDPLQQVMQTLALAKQMKEAFGGGEPQGGGLAGALRELRGLIEIEQMVKDRVNPPPPAPEPADPLLALAPKVLELIQTGMAQREPAGAPLPQIIVPPSLAAVPQAAPAPAAVTAAAPQPNQSAEEQEAMAMLGIAVRWLQSQAGMGADPSAAAETVYEHAPDEIVAMLQRDTWFDELVQIAPAIAGIRDWLTAVRQKVLDIVAEESAPDAAASQAPIKGVANGAGPGARPAGR